MAETLIDVLMRRDGISKEEAQSLIDEASEEMYRRLGEGEIPVDICEEWFGLEQDYIEDLL